MNILKLLFPKSSIIPRWVIFIIDTSICTLSFIFATFLRFNFFIGENFNPAYLYPLPIVVAMRILAILYFRSYAGIIQHTSSQDTLRVFYTVTASSIGLIFINGFYDNFTNRSTLLIPLSIIIIDYFTVLLVMTAFRFSAKIMFVRIHKPHADSVINYAIFGAGEAGIEVKKKLEQSKEENRRVLAFFDDDSKKINSYIDGVTIYSGSSIEEVCKNLKVKELIISPQHLSKNKKQEIIERCLVVEINAKSVPPVERWINGELSFNQLKQVGIEDLLERDAIVLDKGAIAYQMFNKTVMITGAAGSIGGEIAHQILKNFNPLKLILVDISEAQLYELNNKLEQSYKLSNRGNIEIVVGDITNQSRMRRVFERYAPNIIYHSAAYKHVPLMEDNPAEAVRVNVGGTKILSDLAVEFGVEKFVMISTDKAVNPTNVMGASKRIAEIYVQSFNAHLDELDVPHTTFITTRFGNVLGSSGSVIPKFKKQIAEGGPITVTHPDVTRFFMTMPEACQLVLEAGNMGQGGEIYIFDMGKSIKIIDLARKMVQLQGLKIGKDIQLLFTGLRPGEKLKEELLADQELTVRTYHPKIMIAKVRVYDFQFCKNQIMSLLGLYEKQNNQFIVLKMKEIVPEFISQNSIYEELDYKQKQAIEINTKHSYIK